MKKLLLSLFLFLVSNFSIISGQNFGVIYSSSDLSFWQRRYQQTNQEVLQVLLSFLNQSDRDRLSQVRLNIPRTHSNDPFAFSASGNTITTSAQSMMFLWDICLAYTWLSANDCNIGSVNDYVAMLRYQAPTAFTGNRYPKPLEALGIPADVESNQEIYNSALGLFNSARAAVLAHELGHIYYQHPGNYEAGVTRIESQANETEADLFALSFFRQVPELPVGWLLFLQLYSHYDWYGWNSRTATHPMSSERVNQMTWYLQTYANQFARDPSTGRVNSNNLQQVNRIIVQFQEITRLLRDADLQRGIQLAAEQASVFSLQANCSQHQVGSVGFSGYFEGTYTRYLPNNQQEDLAVIVTLSRNGAYVTGAFDFGFGYARITAGEIRENQLYFSWIWGQYSGYGIFQPTSAGGLVGTWGYVNSYDNGGTWSLTRH